MAHPNLCPLSPAHRCNCFHHCLHTVIIEPACNDHWACESQPELSSAPWAVPRCVPPRRHFVSWCQAGRTGSAVYRALWVPAHSLPLPLLPQQRPQGPSRPRPSPAGVTRGRGASSRQTPTGRKRLRGWSPAEPQRGLPARLSAGASAASRLQEALWEPRAWGNPGAGPLEGPPRACVSVGVRSCPTLWLCGLQPHQAPLSLEEGQPETRL